MNDAAEYAAVRRERDMHLSLQREQRLVYYDHRYLGMVHSNQYLSIIIDAMDQSKTYLPVVARRAKNDNTDFLKQHCIRQ